MTLVIIDIYGTTTDLDVLSNKEVKVIARKTLLLLDGSSNPIREMAKASLKVFKEHYPQYLI